MRPVIWSHVYFQKGVDHHLRKGAFGSVSIVQPDAEQCLIMWRTFILSFFVLMSGCKDDGIIKDFHSDGCSLFPDRSLITNEDWCIVALVACFGTFSEYLQF